MIQGNVKLSDLIKDPFPELVEEDEMSAAEAEGRRAVREILDEALSHQELAPEVRVTLEKHRSTPSSSEGPEKPGLPSSG